MQDDHQIQGIQLKFGYFGGSTNYIVYMWQQQNTMYISQNWARQDVKYKTTKK